MIGSGGLGLRHVFGGCSRCSGADVGSTQVLLAVRPAESNLTQFVQGAPQLLSISESHGLDLVVVLPAPFRKRVN